MSLVNMAAWKYLCTGVNGSEEVDEGFYTDVEPNFHLVKACFDID